jgi:aryl-alcohol dehydrogenase-like predicted oxidoreductase
MNYQIQRLSIHAEVHGTAEPALVFLHYWGGTSRTWCQVNPIARVAARWKATPSQVALAWLLSRSQVMQPIPGTSRVEHLEENVAAAALKFEEHKMQEFSRAA